MAIEISRRPNWGQFVAWAVCGASVVLGLLGAFTPLSLVGVAVAGIAVGVALLLGGANISAVGAAAGVGAWCLVLAWTNRYGPGEHCSTSGSETTCDTQWAPWPFLVVGLVFVCATAGLFIGMRRRGMAR